jgi:hypothetical protein
MGMIPGKPVLEPIFSKLLLVSSWIQPWTAHDTTTSQEWPAGDTYSTASQVRMSWLSSEHVPYVTAVALEHNHEVVPGSTVVETMFIVAPSNRFSFIVQRYVDPKVVIRMLPVATFTPCTPASPKGGTFVREICAE